MLNKYAILFSCLILSACNDCSNKQKYKFLTNEELIEQTIKCNKANMNISMYNPYGGYTYDPNFVVKTNCVPISR